MRVSKDKEHKIMALMKVVLARQPDITIYEMQDAMERAGYKMDKDYVNKLLHKIEGEDAHYIETQVLSKAVARMDRKKKAVDQQLWVMVLSKDEWGEIKDEKGVVTRVIIKKAASDMVKTIALKALVDNDKKIFDTHFDAGVFERQLGKLKTESGMSDEEKAALDKIIENVFRTTKPNRTGEGK